MTHQCMVAHVYAELNMLTYTPVTAFIAGPGSPGYNTPPTLSVTLTLNWYCSPPSSPDTTPEETLAGKVVEKLLTQIE